MYTKEHYLARAFESAYNRGKMQKKSLSSSEIRLLIKSLRVALTTQSSVAEMLTQTAHEGNVKMDSNVESDVLR